MNALIPSNGWVWVRCKQWTFLLVVACAMQGGSTTAREFAGQTAENVFKAPHLAELANAACEGDTAGITRAIASGANPNGLSVDGGPPLLWAVGCNNPNGVEALLKAGANPNFRAEGKYSATYAAASAADPRVLRVLLAHGGDPNTDDGGGWTALRTALSLGAHKGQWDNYYTLLNGGADIRAGPETIALFAASLDRFDKVAELLDRGYDRDLTFLGGSVQVSVVSQGSEQAVWKDKVVAMLQQRGVHFPVPPLHRSPE